MVVDDERDAEHLEGDLLGIGMRRDLALVDRLAHGALEGLDPGALAAGEHLAHRPGLVVELARAADHRAAAGQLGRLGPVEPIDEHRFQALHAARPGHRRLEHHPRELGLAAGEHRQQQFLARAEVGEQPGLRQAGRLGEGADGQAVKAGLADEPQPLVEYRLASPLALGHRQCHHGAIK